jgi:hypothetical protein
MRSLFLIILFCISSVSCTSSRWIVIEHFAVDERTEPEIIDQQKVILVDKDPTPDDPFISFSLYTITEKEYPLRVKVERTIQKYRPKWGFVALGVAGATFALLAANSSVILPSLTTSQKLILNVSGGLIGVLSFVNMQPTGDPIYTGESELMRRSGVEIVKDSLRTLNSSDIVADLLVSFEGEELFSQRNLEFRQTSLDVNLASLEPQLREVADEESVIDIKISYNGVSKEIQVPVNKFLAPFLNISEPVANLRNSPQAAFTNIVAEVGRGSFLEIVDSDMEEWYRVKYQETEVYIEKSSGSVEWKAAIESASTLIFEFAEIPFGEIDVENSLPILKPRNPSDKALILTNAIDNRHGIRQYIERDHKLFNHYMRTALQMGTNQISEIVEDGSIGLADFSNELQGVDQTSSLIVYITGFATIKETDGREEIVMIYLDEDEIQHETRLTDLFSSLHRAEPEALFLFVDLEYIESGMGVVNERIRNGGNSLLKRTANELLREHPNSVILFSNRPGQSSGIYTGMIDGNKRHHIFNYFWAEALKQRKTRMSDLIRHLENNVDYNSRRIHDRPQEIQAFGNLTLDIAGR